jgi:hypothetical protein
MVRPEGARGYQMNFASIVAQNEGCAIVRSHHWILLPRCNRFDLAPLQGASLGDVWFPGLKPWAKSFSPFGAGPLGRMRCAIHIYTDIASKLDAETTLLGREVLLRL